MTRSTLAERPEIGSAGRIASAQARRTEKIAKLIESAPPLTPGQLERLRSLLNGNAVGDVGADRS